jgi:hypothetical protein
LFVFNNGSCRNTTSAALKASLQEASFYTQPVIACIRYDRLDENIQRNKRCEFQVRQLVAAYRQFCPKVTMWSSIIGTIFMPGRDLAEKSAARYLLGSKKLTSRIASSVFIEGIEETSRAIITLPPGISLGDNVNSIAQQVSFGASVGLTVNLVTRAGMRGGAAK